MNAYELADALYNETGKGHVDKAANMLRQQADRIAELEKQLNAPKTYVFDGRQVFDTTPQTKPLSDEEIFEIFDVPKWLQKHKSGLQCIEICRAIEERILGK